uniref:DUF5899 domain-containing protein n=1 Tax=viral metagenome TaxID=1070528 RepID=A0A6C0DQU4_9ZZZZ
MDVVIPIFALSALYLVTNKKKQEQFKNKDEDLPNVNIPNMNYPEEYPVISSETQQTNQLSTVNKFDSGSGVYTDKYFSTNANVNVMSAAAISGNVSGNTAATYYSLTGAPVDSTYFQHNNMVPYFGSNIRSRHTDSNSAESVLDNYSGAGSQYISKSEQAPLFSPDTNYQWAHGTPNVSDFMQSRVNPSMRMANVKPFDEERVAPGLGLGYTTSGSNGFNSGMMMRESWTDKTVDQLRVDNKPKASSIGLYGYEGPAESFIKKTGEIGLMEKNRPDTDYAMSSDRYMVTTGIEKAPTLRSIPVDRETARMTTVTDYTGNAETHVKGEYVPGEYMPSHNIQLGALPLAGANANGRQYANDGDFEIKAKRAYPNNRTANNQDDYFGLVSGGLKSAVAPLLDALRPSRRENVIGNLRPYQNPGTRVSESYIFNPADRPAHTIRETTENSKFHLSSDRNNRNSGYAVTQHQPVENNRQTTGDFYYAGNASAGDRTRQMKSYEAEYNQRNNDIKSSTIEGYMVQGNMSMFNNEINMKEATRDTMLQNTRQVAGATLYPLTPDMGNMGKMQGQRDLYSGIQMDRNSADIYDNLKENPYFVNYKQGL